MNSDNNYTKMQKSFYANGTSDHIEHNENPDYNEILLSDVKKGSKWKGKSALDFGCGRGRNVKNLIELCEWGRVDGVDISERNIQYTKRRRDIDQTRSNWFCNNGTDLSELESDNYDFVMSTIALQHIPVHEIRYNLLREIYRVMKTKGIFSFQIGGRGVSSEDTYLENCWEVTTTNSGHDVFVIDTENLVNDLTRIGFDKVTVKTTKSFSDSIHDEWHYVRCTK